MKDKVDFKIFKWAIGILVTVISWQTISMNAMRVDIGTIKTDISWIKDSMNKQDNITLK